MCKLYEHQPTWCREKLPPKEIKAIPLIKKVLEFDPAPIYERCAHLIDPFKRSLTSESISLSRIFINDPPGICACGCGKKLIGRKTRWASEECTDLALGVYMILQGRTGVIYNYLCAYYGGFCLMCRDKEKELFVDHIHPVKLGGAGGWLSNYQLLCRNCHKTKTNKDFGWKGATKPKQYTII